MILAAHQPNFAPWLQFFSKMDQADIFVLLIHVQFEKNGWQNRCVVNGKYWTKPVERGMGLIKNKRYVDGTNLASVNISWIISMAKTLGIDTNKLVVDYPTDLKGTERLVDLCRHYEADTYLTNPEAASKYLDTTFMDSMGIKVIPHTTKFNTHTFEAFSKWGIPRTIELMKREKEKWKTSLSSSPHLTT